MTDQKQESYLVPYDFTKSTEDSLKFALILAHESDSRIILFHIVKKKDELISAELKLNKVLKSLDTKDRDIVSSKVMVGNIFEDIDKMGEMNDASFVVMGSHGPTGLRKILGSNTLKVVSKSSIPFIITQENQSSNKIDTIVMPFSFERESVQITHLAASLAQKYHAKIHLIGFHHKDEWLLRDMKTNAGIIRKYFIKNNIQHEIVNLPGDKPYEVELIEYAREVGADLIAAAYFHHGLKSYLHSFLQDMISNEYKIPVLTINAPEMMTLNSSFSFITT